MSYVFKLISSGTYSSNDEILTAINDFLGITNSTVYLSNAYQYCSFHLVKSENSNGKIVMWIEREANSGTIYANHINSYKTDGTQVDNIWPTPQTYSYTPHDGTAALITPACHFTLGYFDGLLFHGMYPAPTATYTIKGELYACVDMWLYKIY